MEAVIVVDQHDREELEMGNEVEIMFDAAALVSVHGKIIRFSESEMKEVPPSLSITSGGTLDTKTDEMGKTRPISTSYPATCRTCRHQRALAGGLSGQRESPLGMEIPGLSILSLRSQRPLTLNFSRFLHEPKLRGTLIVVWRGA